MKLYIEMHEKNDATGTNNSVTTREEMREYLGEDEIAIAERDGIFGDVIPCAALVVVDAPEYAVIHEDGHGTVHVFGPYRLTEACKNAEIVARYVAREFWDDPEGISIEEVLAYDAYPAFYRVACDVNDASDIYVKKFGEIAS